MLKWTLRTHGDSISCPPSPPNVSECPIHKCKIDAKVDLEDSNKCWYETRVKLAEVKSTSKVVQFNVKENEISIENDEKESSKDNHSVFRRWVSSPSTSEEFEKKRKRHHKHIKCNALDPLRIFTGDITDSDTGSVYMKLDKTPAALMPKEMCSTTTGKFDPRRRPLVDLSNGDYSDIRHHLQHLPTVPAEEDSSINDTKEPPTFYEQLQNYKNQIIPNRNLKQDLEDKMPMKPTSRRPDPIGRSSSRMVLDDPNNFQDSASNLIRFRSTSSAPRSDSSITLSTITTSVTTMTSSPSSVTSVFSNGQRMTSHQYIQESDTKRVLQKQREEMKKRQKQSLKTLLSNKRHSIADIPSAFKRDGCLQAFEVYPEESVCKEARVRHVRDLSKDSTLRGDSDTRLKGNLASKYSEPIYEKLKFKQSRSNSSKLPSGSQMKECSSIDPRNEGNDEYYMTMKNYKEEVMNESYRDDDYEVCVYSSSSKDKPDPKRAPIKLSDFHIYENTLSLSTDKNPMVGATFSNYFASNESDMTCDFTSEPKRNVHKPVAIKGSNELIARFNKMPTDLQEPAVQYGSQMSADSYEKNLNFNDKSDYNYSQRHYENLDFLNLHTSHGCSSWNQSRFHKSTGQHLHTISNVSSQTIPPLQNLRPPAPLPPNNHGLNNQIKLKKKSKSLLRLEHPILPVIYEAHYNEEHEYQTSEEVSYESEEINKSSDSNSHTNSSPRCNSNPSYDNLDSGMSEGVNTPLISPLSGPPSPQSDSLLGDAHTPLSLEDLRICCKENGRFTENEHVSYSADNYFKYEKNVTEMQNISLCSDVEFNQKLLNKKVLNNRICCVKNCCGLTNQSTPVKLEESLAKYFNGKIKSTEMSKLLHDAVEKNLFLDAPSINDESFKSAHNSSIVRRHSFASIKDLSHSKFSRVDSNDETSIWDVENTSNPRESFSLRKSQSFLSLSPATKTCHISLTDKGVKENDAMVNRETAPFFSAINCEVRTTKEAGSCVGDGEGWGRRQFVPGDTAGLQTVNSSGPTNNGSYLSCRTSDLPSCNSRLPEHMQEESNPTERHAGYSSVPIPHQLSKDAVEAHQVLYSCEEVESSSHTYPLLTEKQRRRQEESLFRLDRLLEKGPLAPSVEDDEEVSADWSLEAVLDGTSSPQSSSHDSENSRQSFESADCQDNFSVCTLDSDVAESVYIGPKLCDKIRQVSEEKMLAKLRRSFRKKDKCPQPKVGIFMFVDNPMYVSPEVKKEAKIVTFTPGKLRRSFRKPEKVNNNNQESSKSSWYVGNPMYNSPEPNKVKCSSSVFYTKAHCEKENFNNCNVAKSKMVNGQNNNRVPLSDLWVQANPCYQSPDHVKNILNNHKSPLKRKFCSPKLLKNKPLPTPPLLSDDHYLTPLPFKRPVLGPPVSQPFNCLPADSNILDVQKFIDHEYCTIAGDDSDSWASHSSNSKKSSDSPVAKRNLQFDKNKISFDQYSSNEANIKILPSKSPLTPSRIWRQTSKSDHSTPRKYRGTLEKNSEVMPFSDRGYKTPRAVKRENMNKFNARNLPRDLPSSPAPPLPNFLEDTNTFHHGEVAENALETTDKSSMFQLPPDSIYESLTFVQSSLSNQRNVQTSSVTAIADCKSFSSPSNKKRSSRLLQTTKLIDNQRTTEARSQHYHQRSSSSSSSNIKSSSSISRDNSSGICSGCSSTCSTCSCHSHKATEQPKKVDSSSGVSSSCSKYTTKLVCRRRSRSEGRHNSHNSSRNGYKCSSLNSTCQSLSSSRTKVKRTPKRNFSKKYKARDVLQGKGQLKLSVYENHGLLTIHIIEGRKLKSSLSTVCNPYVKISLVPDNLERTFCRTPLLRATNAPLFDQKFSFDFLPEDLEKRLLISLWSRDTLRKRSEFLGCMSFSVAHITTKKVSGWFRLLTEAVGRRKHFAVSFLNGTIDSSKKLGEVAAEEELARGNHRVQVELDHLQPIAAPRLRTMAEHNNLQTNYGLNPNSNVPSVLGQTPYTLSVNIIRSNEGFGFSVAWTRPPRVERVEPGRAADLAGLRPGDYIIFVGQQNVVRLDENSVLKAIRECGDRLPLEVYRRGVSRTPKTLTNGWARPPSIAPMDPSTLGNYLGSYDTLKRNRIGQVTFNENSAFLLHERYAHLVTSEEHFCSDCKFGLERYLIPLKFRVDLLTPSAHFKLFTSIEQILDITESIVKRFQEKEERKNFSDLGIIYHSVLDHIVEDYSQYFEGLAEADKLLSSFLCDLDFKEFLLYPQVPAKKPDITTFLHLPCAHFREVIALLEDIVAVSGGRSDYYFLKEVYDKLLTVYKKATSDQTVIKSQTFSTFADPLPMSPQNRNFSPARKPLVTTFDIEKRLVFLKPTKPFKLSNNNRQWLFGSELSKFEGRNLKQYWAMLFTDLMLLTSVNRDRVIYVMEDPIFLETIIDANFHVKKKATEFRLVQENVTNFTMYDIEGCGSTGYLSCGSNSGSNSRTSTLSQGRLKTKKLSRRRICTVYRTPSLRLKATWEKLLNQQIDCCRNPNQRLQLNRLYGFLTPSISRAASQDGAVTNSSFHLNQDRCESCDDLRPSDIKTQEQEFLLLLDNDNEDQSAELRRKKESLDSSTHPLTTNYPSAVDLPIVRVDNYEENGPTQSENGDFKGETDINLNVKIPKSEQDDIIIEDIRSVHDNKSKEEKISFGLKVKNKLFSNRINRPPKKTINKSKNVAKFVDSILIVQDTTRSVTPLFDHEEHFNQEDFESKRLEMLQKKHHNYSEGREEMIIMSDEEVNFADTRSPKRSVDVSPTRTELLAIQERRKQDSVIPKKKDEKKSTLRLNGIEEESPVKRRQMKELITPEGYEEYLDDRIELDYPELKANDGEMKIRYSASDFSNDIERTRSVSPFPKTFSLESDVSSIKDYPEIICDNYTKSPCPTNALLYVANNNNLETQDFSKFPNSKTATPLSGSSSMSFMDETTTPTSTDGSVDFYQRTTRNAMKFEAKSCNYKNKSSRALKPTVDNSSLESVNELNCVRNISKFGSSSRKLTNCSVSFDTSDLRDENNSSNSSMSISSNSFSSNHINGRPPKTTLFIPTNACSLPEISIEPPTPQALKPRENYDPETKIAYDLRVPGYSSMFLTVPGFEDFDEDRYLPGTKYDAKVDDSSGSDSCGSSSSDDDVVHKPRVLASLMGIAKRRGLKSYGSSCDLSKFGLSSPSDNEDNKSNSSSFLSDDQVNGNIHNSSDGAKIGGTKSGPFVAEKLEMFEQVVEIETKNYIKNQEVRQRLACKVPRAATRNYSNMTCPSIDFGNYFPNRHRNGTLNDHSKTDDDSGQESGPEVVTTVPSMRSRISRQWTLDSNSSLRKKEIEVLDLLDKSLVGTYGPPSKKDSVLKNHSQSSPTLYTSSRKQPLTPIIRQMQSTTSQGGSPSRVRFSAVTDVFTRESSDSSDKEEDTDYRIQYNEIQVDDTEDEEEGQPDNRLHEKSDLNASKSSLSKVIFGKSKTKKEKCNAEKSSPKRFAFFRSPKKEQTTVTDSSKSTKGKRRLFASKGSGGSKSSSEEFKVIGDAEEEYL